MATGTAQGTGVVDNATTGRVVETLPSRRLATQDGYAMAALLVGMAVMAVIMSAALPVWHTQMRREREEEWVFRARQYARAVALFQRKYANAFPPTVDVLFNERFLRKKWKDPITNEDFELVRVGSVIPGQTTPPADGRTGAPGQAGRIGAPTTGGAGRAGTPQAPASSLGQARIGQAGGGGGIMGVTSKSKDKSLRLLNGRDSYDQWVVLGTEASLFGGRGGVGAQTPGGRGGAAPGGVRGGQPPGGRGGSGTGSGSGTTGGSRFGRGFQSPSTGR